MAETHICFIHDGRPFVHPMLRRSSVRTYRSLARYVWPHFIKIHEISVVKVVFLPGPFLSLVLPLAHSLARSIHLMHTILFLPVALIPTFMGSPWVQHVRQLSFDVPLLSLESPRTRREWNPQTRRREDKKATPWVRCPTGTAEMFGTNERS